MPRTSSRRPPGPIAASLGRRLVRLGERAFPPPDDGRARKYQIDIDSWAEAAAMNRTSLYHILRRDGHAATFAAVEALCLACGATVADLYDA